MSKPTYWTNSDFGLAYFIAGKCHTPDEAHRLLSNNRQRLDVSIRGYEASKLRALAKRMMAEAVLATEQATEVHKLQARADLLEMDAFAEQERGCIEDAIHERDAIDQMLKLLEPKLAYPGNPQAAQREEWCLELMQRAEDFILTTGTLPADQLATMRAHPDFRARIFPHVKHVMELKDAGKADRILVDGRPVIGLLLTDGK